MFEEITIVVEDRPGMLADIGEALGRAGVNIETLSAFTTDGQGVIQLVVDDEEDAAEALKAEGIAVEGSRSVMVVTLDDRPGELGRYCRRLAEAGVTISGAYLSKRGGGETELIFTVDDLEAALQAG
ncbi:MAG TPA: ACT domain-containing protein [Actinomycetota bacterium]|nr:ACT domain-containing protein [Actinomycetota bacterium]